MGRQSKLTPGQWIEVEAQYRATNRPIRDIASEYGINEATLRERAKKLCWIREPAEAKRALVEAKVAGITTDSPQEATQVLLHAQADADAETLKASAELYRRVLARLAVLLDGAEDGRDLKTVAEAARLATDGYTKVRGLDKQSASSDMDKLREALELARAIE